MGIRWIRWIPWQEICRSRFLLRIWRIRPWIRIRRLWWIPWRLWRLRIWWIPWQAICRLKLTPMQKPKLTVMVMAVDTDTEVMVDTVEVMEVTDMVDTGERGPLIPKLTVTVMAVDTDMVDTVEVMVVTVMAVDTVMAVEVTTDRFYYDLFLSKFFFY